MRPGRRKHALNEPLKSAVDAGKPGYVVLRIPVTAEAKPGNVGWAQEL